MTHFDGAIPSMSSSRLSGVIKKKGYDSAPPGFDFGMGDITDSEEQWEKEVGCCMLDYEDTKEFERRNGQNIFHVEEQPWTLSKMLSYLNSRSSFPALTINQAQPIDTAVDLIKLFGNDLRHIIIIRQTLKKMGCKQVQTAYKSSLDLYNAIAVGISKQQSVADIPNVRNHLLTIPFSSENNTADHMKRLIETTAFLFYDIKQQMRFFKFLPPRGWAPQQKKQEELLTHLYYTLKLSPEKKAKVPVPLLRSLFTTASMHTSYGPVFAGESVLEWGKRIREMHDFAMGYLKLHPQGSFITQEKAFLPFNPIETSEQKAVPRRLPPSKIDIICGFQLFMVYRTVEAIEFELAGCPPESTEIPSLPKEVKHQLIQYFSSNESLRMEVSFVVSFPQQFLKEELPISGHRMKVLSPLRPFLNNLAHIPKKSRADPAMEQIYEWIYHSNQEKIPALFRHDYQLAINELEKEDESPMPHAREPRDIVQAVAPLQDILKDEEEFKENALAFAFSYIYNERAGGCFKFLLEVHKSPFMVLHTKHILDYVLEKSHLESLEDDEVFFEFLKHVLPKNLSGPSEKFFTLLIKPYKDSCNQSFPARKKLVGQFFALAFFKGSMPGNFTGLFNEVSDPPSPKDFLNCLEKADPINSDHFFHALHSHLRGTLPLQVQMVFDFYEQFFPCDLSPSAKLFLLSQELPPLPAEIDEETAQYAALIFKGLPHQFEEHHRLHLFYLLIAKHNKLENLQFVRMFEAFLGMQLSPDLAYHYLIGKEKKAFSGAILDGKSQKCLKLEEMNQTGSEEIFSELTKLRSHIAQQQLSKFSISPSTIEEIEDQLGAFLSFLGMNDGSMNELESCTQFLVRSALLNDVSIYHARCFPIGVTASGVLEFPKGSAQYALLPLHHLETMKSSLGYWTQTEQSFTYHFSLVHTATLTTFSGSACLPLSPQMLKNEKEFFFILKELAWATFSDFTNTWEEPITRFSELMGLLDKRARNLWAQYIPQELDKDETIGPALFEFYEELKLCSREATLFLAMQDELPHTAMQKKLQRVGAVMNIRSIEHSSRQIFTILPEGEPFSPFYSVLEDVTPLVSLLNEEVIQGGKELDLHPVELRLCLTEDNEKAIDPEPQVQLTCKPQEVDYEDPEYNKLYEDSCHFAFQGYTMTMRIQHRGQIIETALTLSEKELSDPKRAMQCMQYLTARLKCTFYNKIPVEKRKVSWPDEIGKGSLKQEQKYKFYLDERRENYESSLHSDIIPGERGQRLSDRLKEFERLNYDERIRNSDRLIEIKLKKFDRRWTPNPDDE
ncbi:hypothetical protein [Simkania sp.]|uniref:hypothetical protein n=1 Tax=Simkania sp. TaxID=34094 RepID=UPI003B516F6A